VRKGSAGKAWNIALPLLTLSAAFILFIISLKLLSRDMSAPTSVVFSFSVASTFFVAAWASVTFLLATRPDLADLVSSSFSLLLFSRDALSTSTDALSVETSLFRRETSALDLPALASAWSFRRFIAAHSFLSFSTLARACACSSGSIWLNLDTRPWTRFFHAST